MKQDSMLCVGSYPNLQMGVDYSVPVYWCILEDRLDSVLIGLASLFLVFSPLHLCFISLGSSFV